MQLTTNLGDHPFSAIWPIGVAGGKRLATCEFEASLFYNRK